MQSIAPGAASADVEYRIEFFWRLSRSGCLNSQCMPGQVAAAQNKTYYRHTGGYQNARDKCGCGLARIGCGKINAGDLVKVADVRWLVGERFAFCVDRRFPGVKKIEDHERVERRDNVVAVGIELRVG